jgi:hypothetical protein
MNQFEYLLMFASVILAMAVSDVITSLNRLLSAGARIRWDWLSPLAATLAFLKIVNQWWAWFGASTFAGAMTFGMFLGVLVSAVLLFLLAASALPDSLEEGADLRAYYQNTARRFWLLFAAHIAVEFAVSDWLQVSLLHARFSLNSPLYLLPLVGVALAIWRNRIVHTVSLVALIGLYAGHSFSHALGQ